MRVVLTRAADDAERTRAKLEAMGHRVIVSPVIEIVGTGERWPDGVVDLLLATSGQAFCGMDETTAPSLETRRLLPLFLVGERTADCARKHGFAGPLTITPNVAVLAVAMGKIAVPPRSPVYLAGRHRKPDLETAMDVIGIKPTVVETYEARATPDLTPEAIDCLQKGTPRVLHFSHRSAALFAQGADAAGIDIRPLTHLCLSEDASVPLRSAGCESIEVAEEPNEAALLRLVGTL